MAAKNVVRLLALIVLLILGAIRAAAQQKPQWVPGQVGLNAGLMPAPGFSYLNITINYDANAFNDPNGKPVPVTGSYNVWAVENLFYFVPNFKVLGGNVNFGAGYPIFASGSLVADIPNPAIPNLSVAAGGSGVADLWLQPIGIGWHFKRAAIQVMNGMMLPTGRYAPGATNNVGSGYFGNHLQSGTTLYLTKNQGTSLNLFTDWEVHGTRAGTNNTTKTPGQAFTTEWGLGQVLPLKKDLSQLLQLGVIGYDQWQINANGGTAAIGNVIVPASIIPKYSVHAAGGQVTYIVPSIHLAPFFKYEHEYAAHSHSRGNTLVFGLSWTWPIPKAH